MCIFDTFLVKNARCELCGHVYDGDFQSKAFEPCMRVFKQGDNTSDLVKEESRFSFIEGNVQFEMHDVCPKCGKFFETWGIIKNYVFLGQTAK